MSPNTAPDFVGYNTDALPPVVPAEEPKMPPPPPFSIKNRSRAQKLAKVLYGPQARVWINRLVPVTDPDATPKTTFGVQVGTERGAEKKILAQGETLSAALRVPVETYVKGGSDYGDTKKRLREMSLYADVWEFVTPALRQFDEYKNEVNKSVKSFEKLMAKGKELVEKAKQ